MGWQHYSLDLIARLTWPVVALTILLIFRKPVEQILVSIKSVSFRAANIEIEAELSSIVSTAATSALEGDKANGTRSTRLEGALRGVSPWDLARELAERDPYAGVARAGRELSVAIARVAAPYGQPLTEVIALEKLAAGQVIPAQIANAATQLVRLRNSLAAQPARGLSPQNAYGFIDACEQIAGLLDARRSPGAPRG